VALPLAYAQQNSEPAAPPTIVIPGNEAAPTIIAPPANAAAPAVAPEHRPPPVAEKPPAPPLPPPGPVRSPTAILRVLDKVTAETLRFEAPVGRRVRYKTLIFMVKACETRGLRDPLPRPSAYLIIDSEPTAPQGRQAPEAREVYRGWMFADSPGLHPFEHPVYDTWLEGCTTDTPPA
jgi:hypothetical protein